MANRSLNWVECDTPGCASTTREHASPDDEDLANRGARALGWSHYSTIENHRQTGLYDVCPVCLASRPDLAALCAIEHYYDEG